MDIPMVEGVSKAGKAWKKKEWVLETPGMYPRRVKIHVFGDRADQLNFEVGKAYKVDFDLESREFNGRWYTDVRGFKVEKAGAGAPVPPNNIPGGLPGDFPPAPADLTPTPGATDDLPF